MSFDFTQHIRALCADMVARVPEFSHIDMSRVAVGFSQARKATPHGVFATLTPLRFTAGQSHTIRRGQRWAIPSLTDASGVEMLYILSFCLPRFLNLKFRQKLTTTAHELWHIGPRFDGDLRRFNGRCYAHGASRETFNAEADRLVDSYMATDPDPSIYAFLQKDFRTLHAQHDRIVGAKFRPPKLVRLP
jgi:hypothetical protein